MSVLEVLGLLFLAVAAFAAGRAIGAILGTWRD